jgi:hypothetical protein
MGSRNRRWGVRVFGLSTVVPRIGEKVELEYFQECCGTRSFYVKKIRHFLDRGCQTIEIELADGDYNLFWHLRLDEALEKMQIDWREAFWGNDYELKKKLGVIPKWYYDNQ